MKNSHIPKTLYITLCSLLLSCSTLFAHNLPEGFTYLEQVDATILQEMRYAGDNNFAGRPIKGYFAAKCIVTSAAAQKLKEAQQYLLTKGYSLKVFDAYRPQKAVDDFYTWAQNTKDQKMKALYYPNEDKATLFAKGYIAQYSGHTRGSTLDLTIVKIITDSSTLRVQYEEVDMGTCFDFFGVQSHTASLEVSAQARQNRMFLKEAMEQHGFKNLEEQWWHYTLLNEPFANKYFDFAVE